MTIETTVKNPEKEAHQEVIEELATCVVGLLDISFDGREPIRDDTVGRTNVFIGPLDEEYNNGTNIDVYDRLTADEDGLLARVNLSQVLKPGGNMRAHYLQTSYSVSREGGVLKVERHSDIPSLGYMSSSRAGYTDQYRREAEKRDDEALRAVRVIFADKVKQGPVLDGEIVHLTSLLKARHDDLAHVSA